jgi:hypothetical protein
MDENYEIEEENPRKRQHDLRSFQMREAQQNEEFEAREKGLKSLDLEWELKEAKKV